MKKTDAQLIWEALEGKKEQGYNTSMPDNDITNWTDLVADAEHISDDLNDTFSKLTDKQRNKLIKFVQLYMHTAIETAVENPEWFK